MIRTENIMGMPIRLELVNAKNAEIAATRVFDYFRKVDAQYSTYKPDSEISRINAGLPEEKWSEEMKAVFKLCEQTKRETNGFFDILRPDGSRDPSGLVKGWAINNAAQLLHDRSIDNFYLEAGGDIQVHGRNPEGKSWRIGIRNPFNREEIVKVIAVSDEGMATSGTYTRGQHIYNPLKPKEELHDIRGITVVGPNVYEADRFATAAFAMGRPGIAFIETLPGFEAYMIDSNKVATLTSGFERYVV
jgi:FAD:protein FMN transferase